MTRATVLILGLLAGCVTATQPLSSGSSSSEEPFPPPAQSCFTDADCFGGSCQVGTCSPIPPAPAAPPPPSPPGVGTPCTSGMDCSDNICQGLNCQ